jgi:hypothetical protein
MAAKMIVGPTRRAADRRTPERLAENAPDHTAGDRADGTGYDEPGSCSRGSANPVGACVRRGHGDNGQHIRCQDETPHPRHPAFTTNRRRKPSLGHGSGMRERFHKFVANVRRLCGLKGGSVR